MAFTSTAPEIIMGIDPGFDRIGWAVGKVAKNNVVEPVGFGLIQTNKTDSIFDRYLQLHREFSQVLEHYKPCSAGIENLYFSKNTTTALRVSEAKGIIIGLVLAHGCSITEYNPVQVKQAVTGFGQADKRAIEKMIRLQLKITENNIIDDTMDALALLLTHSTQKYLEKRLI